MIAATREGHAVGRRVGHHLVAHDTRDGLARDLGHRGLQQQAMVAGQQIAHPAANQHRVAVAKEEAVTCVVGSGRVVAELGVVEVVQGLLFAAVADLVEDGAVGAGQIAGAEDEHVGGELDEPPRVTRGVFEIDNVLVSGVVGIDREAGDAAELLVGPDLAKGLTAGERLASVPFERNQLGPRLCGQQHGQRASERNKPSSTGHHRGLPPVLGESV